MTTRQFNALQVGDSVCWPGTADTGTVKEKWNAAIKVAWPDGEEGVYTLDQLDVPED